MIQEPKRHHYVPQMLSRRFKNKNGKLFCFHRDSPDKVFETTPENAFVAKHLYTQYDEQGNKDVSGEKELAKLEGQANEIIEKITQAARLGKEPRLTDSEKETWDIFFCCQSRRTPEKRDDIQNSSLVSEVLNEFEREIRPLTNNEREKFNQPREQHRLLKNAWAQIVPKPGGELLEVLRNQGIGIGIIRNTRKSFILGSNPIVKITPDGHTHLSDPKVEALLPISHDVIVTPGLSRGEEQLVEVKEMTHIREINKAIFNQSDMVAGRSRELMESLAGLLKQKA